MLSNNNCRIEYFENNKYVLIFTIQLLIVGIYYTARLNQFVYQCYNIFILMSCFVSVCFALF